QHRRGPCPAAVRSLGVVRVALQIDWCADQACDDVLSKPGDDLFSTPDQDVGDAILVALPVDTTRPPAGRRFELERMFPGWRHLRLVQAGHVKHEPRLVGVALSKAHHRPVDIVIRVDEVEAAQRTPVRLEVHVDAEKNLYPARGYLHPTKSVDCPGWD